MFDLLTYIDTVFESRSPQDLSEEELVAFFSPKAQTLREYYSNKRDLGRTNLYKDEFVTLCYLPKYMPSTFHSTEHIIKGWTKVHFEDWINKKADLGICSFGSGPGSDVFGMIYSLNNKSNHGKKISNIVRYEIHEVWEQYYQDIKNGIINGPNILPNNFRNGNEIYGSIQNINDSINTVLSSSSDKLINSKYHVNLDEFSKCDILCLQNVLGDPVLDGSTCGEVTDYIVKIVGKMKKPCIILVSDIIHSFVKVRINDLKQCLNSQYDLSEIMPLTEINKNHDMNYPNFYRRIQNTQMNYKHNHTIWEINEKQ